MTPQRQHRVRARDARLGQLRQVTRWVGYASAALAGLLAAGFAAAVPGHATAPTAPTPQQQSPTPQLGGVTSPDTGSGSGQLQQPTAPPTYTPAPPVVVSGGS